MIRSRFFWQLYGSYVLLVTFLAAALYVVLSYWLDRDSRSEIRTNLTASADLIQQLAEPVLRGAAPDQLQAQLVALSKNPTRVTIIGRDGTVKADTREDPKQMGNHLLRPEIVMASKNGTGATTRLSATARSEMVFVSKQVRSGDEVLGYVRTAWSLDKLKSRINALRGLVLTAALFAAAGALLLGLLVARLITAPMERITEAAKALAAGQTSAHVDVASTNEAGSLAAAFNSMARQLESRLGLITQERNTLETILGSMVEGVIAVDQHEQIVHINEVAACLLGIDPDKVRGQRIWDATRVDELSKALASTVSSGKDYRTQARILRDSRDILLEISAGPLRDADDQHVGAAVVFHDITDLRRLEVVRREFVTNASHELKTPITAIRGFLETLSEDPDMPPEVRQNFVERAMRQSGRLSALVTDLLRLSQVETQANATELQPLDLRVAVRRTIDQLVIAADAKGVTLELDLPDGSVMILGDPQSLDLMITNLVDNGIKYTDAGGQVTVQMTVGGGHVTVRFRDTGIGIAPEHLSRIFERFYRVDKARSRELGGTGLGLAIVKHACTMLGGTIDVESEFGQGTCFRVQLPIAKTEATVD